VKFLKYLNPKLWWIGLKLAKALRDLKLHPEKLKSKKYVLGLLGTILALLVGLGLLSPELADAIKELLTSLR